VWGPPTDPDAARAVLRRAVELGVNHIDTSQVYGPNVVNELIAEVMTRLSALRAIGTSGVRILGRSVLPERRTAPIALRGMALNEELQEFLRTRHARLEHGRELQPSDQVLDAIARALRLAELERRTSTTSFAAPLPDRGSRSSTSRHSMTACER
jgi:hypothetical protein